MWWKNSRIHSAIAVSSPMIRSRFRTERKCSNTKRMRKKHVKSTIHWHICTCSMSVNYSIRNYCHCQPKMHECFLLFVCGACTRVCEYLLCFDFNHTSGSLVHSHMVVCATIVLSSLACLFPFDHTRSIGQWVTRVVFMSTCDCLCVRKRVLFLIAMLQPANGMSFNLYTISDRLEALKWTRLVRK